MGNRDESPIPTVKSGTNAAPPIKRFIEVYALGILFQICRWFVTDRDARDFSYGRFVAAVRFVESAPRLANIWMVEILNDSEGMKIFKHRAFKYLITTGPIALKYLRFVSCSEAWILYEGYISRFLLLLLAHKYFTRRYTRYITTIVKRPTL